MWVHYRRGKIKNASIKYIFRQELQYCQSNNYTEWTIYNTRAQTQVSNKGLVSNYYCQFQ